MDYIVTVCKDGTPVWRGRFATIEDARKCKAAKIREYVTVATSVFDFTITSTPAYR